MLVYSHFEMEAMLQGLTWYTSSLQLYCNLPTYLTCLDEQNQTPKNSRLLHKLDTPLYWKALRPYQSIMFTSSRVKTQTCCQLYHQWSLVDYSSGDINQIQCQTTQYLRSWWSWLPTIWWWARTCPWSS
jgi:hypothetical protein